MGEHFLSLLVVLLTRHRVAGTLRSLEPNPWHQGHDAPLFPASNILKAARDIKTNASNTIPKKVWIAVRNISDSRPAHLDGFVKRNPAWQVIYCDNNCKDDFMRTAFANTSILWAYNILNPMIGTAKVEVWRLAVLYTYGGLYMDDDANIQTPLDHIITASDGFVGGEEEYKYDDRCYVDSYRLSNASFIKRFGDEAYKNVSYCIFILGSDVIPILYLEKVIFNNKFFFNWAMMSVPQHELLKRSLQYGVGAYVCITFLIAQYAAASL
jgi:hypothetical protein